MAHTILVRIDVDDEYADVHPDITATDYLEGSKAYGWEVVTERVFTESEVDELIRAGNAMSVAMYQYQMDVDDDPPQKHRDMMNAWEAAVRRLSDPA